MDYHSDNPFAIPDKCLTSAPAVIPAQAGIQWFTQYMLAQASMIILNHPFHHCRTEALFLPAYGSCPAPAPVRMRPLRAWIRSRSALSLIKPAASL